MASSACEFGRVLIANRGEVAIRIARACRLRGLESVAVVSDADRLAPHATAADRVASIGPASARESYLCIEALLGAAKAHGADAVHPGYGFLAENADFARAVRDAGLVWIGPPAEVIALMGDKLAARETARAAGVPLLPGAYFKVGTRPPEIPVLPGLHHPRFNFNDDILPLAISMHVELARRFAGRLTEFSNP
jgi:acetyl/propionyl-CoA carboxylase alpha subunit